jgi:uncharacterized membrane protein YfcA
MEIIFTYILVGIAAGVLAGMFGVGGGLVIVPVLVVVFGLQGVSPSVIVHLAIGTSLATIVVTSLSSMRAHHSHGAVLWDVFRRLTPGIVVGALLGAVIADFLPTPVLRVIFAIFELAVAIQIFFHFMASPHRQLPDKVGMTAAGVVIGVVSSIVGIGGGTMTVPFLVWCNIPIRQAVATSSACGFPISVAGAAGFVLTGWNEAALPPSSTGYLYWPAFIVIALASVLSAPLGAKLTHTLPVEILRRVFAGLLVVLGLRMLIG